MSRNTRRSLKRVFLCIYQYNTVVFSSIVLSIVLFLLVLRVPFFSVITIYLPLGRCIVCSKCYFCDIEYD